MENEDLIKLPPSSSSSSETENDVVHDLGCESSRGKFLHENSEVREDGVCGRIQEITGHVNNEDHPPIPASDFDEDMEISPPPASQISIELNETVAVIEKVTCLSSEMHAENGSAVGESISVSNHKEDIHSSSTQDIKATAICGAKRARIGVDEKQPSVRVIYDSLTRESKQKLEELLQQWSQWHARHCPSSNDLKVSESGEEVYFPALDIGLDKASAVSFWMDSQTTNLPNKEFIPLDGNIIPLYDRGFSLALASDGSSNMKSSSMEVLNASRCFNCGSYSHSLRECPKPRDSTAVNNARKQHKSRRSQNANSRNPTRYYQNTPGGKFDGLRPGALDAETRKLLGLGEFDPPPWLNRMREIGYPPGYLDPEERDQPSGITIFADEEIKQETEEGEILEADHPEPPRKLSPEPPKKMSVEFPGINAPIPENADKRRWGAASPNRNLPRSYSHRRYDYSAGSISRGHYYGSYDGPRDYQDGHYYGSYDGPRDYQDDGPPGTDFRLSSHRSSILDYGYDSFSPSSPPYRRSLSDRYRSSPFTHGDHPDLGYHGWLP